MILSRPIRVYTERPIRESDLETTLRVEGHPEIGRLVAPTSELKGWDGYAFRLEGLCVHTPAEDAPRWSFVLSRSTLTLEVRSAAAFRPDSPLYALVEWMPGAKIQKSIVAVGDQWTDADLIAAGYALRRLHAMVDRRGPGRPLLYDATSEPQFFAELDKAAHAAVHNGERLSWASLERHGGVGWRTYRDAAVQFGYDLDAIEAEANRCRRGRGQNICRFLVGRRAEFKKKRP